MRRSWHMIAWSLFAAACSSAPQQAVNSDTASSDTEYRDGLVTGMHESLATEMAVLVQAAKALRDSAPVLSDRGWGAESDAGAIASMRDAWRRSRIAYEHIEGAVAPIFPDIDLRIDGRYDAFLTELGGTGDADPFDAEGVTGMHAIERVLFATSVRPEVIAFESTLPGYRAPRWPSTAAEAQTFRSGLAQRLLDDLENLQAQWLPARIDLGVAFQGLIALMNEQSEKVNKTATGAEESRYADVTLFDLRNNLEGTATIYQLFRPWIAWKASSFTAGDAATSADNRIIRGLAELRSLYGEYPGDSIPLPPTSWSSLRPTPEDLATPFGRLFANVEHAVDPQDPTSLVASMNEVAALLGFPAFQVGK